MVKRKRETMIWSREEPRSARRHDRREGKRSVGRGGGRGVERVFASVLSSSPPGFFKVKRKGETH